MSPLWKTWILYLTFADFLVFLGLWFDTKWGEVGFLSVALSQLVAYIFFQNLFPDQWSLVVFHFITLVLYFAFKILIFDGKSFEKT